MSVSVSETHVSNRPPPGTDPRNLHAAPCSVNTPTHFHGARHLSLWVEVASERVVLCRPSDDALAAERITVCVIDELVALMSRWP